MRTFLLFIVIGVLAACSGNSGPVQEYTLHVYGNNEQCKRMIDSAAYAVKGVSLADWHIDSKLLTVKIDTNIVSTDAVLQTVAHAGFDNELYYGDDYVYGALPLNCQYERREHELK